MPVRYCCASILLFPFALLGAETASLVPDTHPNHYVLMLDSSGSMLNSAVDREIYREVLESKIRRRLERDGFGKEIPPMQTGVDSLTVFHFGLGDASSPVIPWQQLAAIDISSQFISTAIVQESGKAVRLMRATSLPPNWPISVLPGKATPLTGVALARFFGLWALAPGRAAANKTFLIVVHDEEGNYKTPWEEREGLVRLMRDVKKEARAKAILKLVQDSYSFGPDQGPVWEDHLVSGDKSVFVDAYAVTPSSDREWTEQQRKFIPMVTPGWTWQSGSRARVRIELDPAFAQRMPEARSAEWTVKVQFPSFSKEIKVPYEGLSRIELTGVPIPQCGSPPETLRTTARIPQQPQADELLGLRHFSLEIVKEDHLPAPFGCTTAGKATRWGSLTGGLVAANLLGYCLIFGFRRTHLRVELPGKIRDYEVPRTGTLQGWTPVSPRPNTLALSIRLPNPLWQLLLYRGATLTLLNPDGFPVRFHSGLGPQDTFAFPSPLRRVAAFWDGVPSRSTEIHVGFRHGGQQGAVTLRYPEGVNR